MNQKKVQEIPETQLTSVVLENSQEKELYVRKPTSNGISTTPVSTPTSSQFLSVRIRLGKKFQANIPDLITTELPIKSEIDTNGTISTEIENGKSSSYNRGKNFSKRKITTQSSETIATPCRNVMNSGIAKHRFCPIKAKELGEELEKYLDFARTLREGAVFESDEQVVTMALEYLHRFQYNPTDAACSLYAHHSVEYPTAPGSINELNTPYSPLLDENDSEECFGVDLDSITLQTKWLVSFYRYLRLPHIKAEHLRGMQNLHDQAHSRKKYGLSQLTEVGVLKRQISRINSWMESYEIMQGQKVDRGELQCLLNEADDLRLNIIERDALCDRIAAFDKAVTLLKDAVYRGGRSKQHSTKISLTELEQYFNNVKACNIQFSDEERLTSLVYDAKRLKESITNMLDDDKVSLPLIREVLAKIEAVPVNFEQEIELFQNKLLSAQSWLTKVRKIIPKRRQSRRGGPDTKKIDLESIRELARDAPSGDNTEIFEVHELLECADEWALKVKNAIDEGPDVPLTYLKELMDEGNDMPVNMDEQKYLQAEIQAREWCLQASILSGEKSTLEAMEKLLADAKSIRSQLHPKKRSRWKPQIERDIQVSIDTTKKWVVEVREILGNAVFEKLLTYPAQKNGDPRAHDSILFADIMPAVHRIFGPTPSTSASSKLSSKKDIQMLVRLVKKVEELPFDVSTYSLPISQVLQLGNKLRHKARLVLHHVGVSTEPRQQSTEQTSNNLVQKFNNDSSSSISKDESCSLEEIKSTDNESDLINFSLACSLLEAIKFLPFSFSEGIILEEVLDHEKLWAQRVQEALPTRHSRKNRTTNGNVSLQTLEKLLEESCDLKFEFPEEVKLLTKEISDVRSWQEKMRTAITHVVESRELYTTLCQLRDIDLLVYQKFQEVKHLKKSQDSQTHDNRNDEVKSEMVTLGAVNESNSAALKTSTELDRVNGLTSLSNQEITTNFDTIQQSVAVVGNVPSLLTNTIRLTDTVNSAVLNYAKVDEIMNHFRRDSGRSKKERSQDTTPSTNNKDIPLLNPTVGDNNTPGDSMQSKQESKNHDGEHNMTVENSNSMALMHIVLSMVEESMAAITSIDIKDEIKQSVLSREELEDISNIMPGRPDNAVKLIENWKSQLENLSDEGSLLNADAPEMIHLRTIINLIEWFLFARSLFYDEPLALKELVDKGKSLEILVSKMKDDCIWLPSSNVMATIECMLWPLKQLETHDAVVTKWTNRVMSCLADKHTASVDDLQVLVVEGRSLLMEINAFKPIQEELKKSKIWLSKLRKRLKANISKHIGRMSMNIVKGLVEDGDGMTLEIPAWDFLKENMEKASAWETRVKESGIETGKAQISTLINLMDEYNSSEFLIDLDMHAEVLKSATERYCICRQPFDGLMIGCDFCDDWFHDNCIGMSKEKAEKTENYTCPSCTILQDLKSNLSSTVSMQPRQWEASESVKSYEKQLAVATRKVKREEKGIERNEIALVSSSNHLNQLRNRIEDAERTQACLNVAANVNVLQMRESRSGIPLPSINTKSDTLVTSVHYPPSSSKIVGQMEPNNNQKNLVSANNYANSEVHSLNVSNPNVNTVPSHLPDLPTVNTHMNEITDSNESQMNGENKQVEPSSSHQTQLNSIELAGRVTNISMPISSQGHNTTTLTPASGPTTLVPAMLAPMLPATSLETTERLSALIVAGGVEQQLVKMRAEYNDIVVRVNDLKAAISLGKTRLESAEQSLRELMVAHETRQQSLPIAKAWVCQALKLICDAPTVLNRRQRRQVQTSDESNFNFLPQVYDDLLAQENIAKINELFPQVQLYTRLLRMLAWSHVVVCWLQERPSRERISSAICYAIEHNIWEKNIKSIAALRGVVGRVDVWIHKVHKCLTKSAASTTLKSQKLNKLKGIMNEYSKLPLTCDWIEKLENYLRIAQGDVAMNGDHQQKLLEAESAVVAAVADAVNLEIPSSIPKPQRKRKPYTRRVKSSDEAVGTEEKKPRSKKLKTDNPSPINSFHSTSSSASVTHNPSQDVDMDTEDLKNDSTADSGSHTKVAATATFDTATS